jgi:hypothetical protein
MSASTRVPRTWTKSSYSGQQGDCVEWRRASTGTGIETRDSKNPEESMLISSAAWTTFISLIRTMNL